MSNEGDWRKEMEDMIARVVHKELENHKELSPPSSPSTPVKPETHQGHETIEEILSCPNCYPKIRDGVLKKEHEERKNLDLECKECGLPVKREEPTCPSCGGKTAIPRRK